MFIFVHIEVVEVEEVELHRLVDAVQTVQQGQVERGRPEGGVPAAGRSQVRSRLRSAHFLQNRDLLSGKNMGKVITNIPSL